MAKDIEFLESHLTFAGPGAQTQTITIPDTHHALVVWTDVWVGAATTVEIKVGSTNVTKGTMAAEASPRQLRFGKGRGSGGFGDDITVALSAAGEVFVGYIKRKDQNPS